MEYVSGGTLKKKMASGMPLAEVTRIINEVASALTYAHSRGIVHRDVKPVNVLMDGNGRAVLSDFGIAKILQTSAVLTQSGAGVGTPEYMSPEQCRGTGNVDARSDIYALGVMLYEMLTGHTPFEADSYTALAHSHIYEAVPPPSKLNPRISPAVQAVVMKALEKSPADRFQKATDMAVALEEAAAAQQPLNVPSATGSIDGIANVPKSGSAPVICPRCQGLNTPSQRFCSTCGQALHSPHAPYSPQRAPTGPYPSENGDWVRCPSCNAPNQAFNRFCTTCGFSLLAGVVGFTCQACGARNSAGQRFCTACGHSLRP
jgi:serine/threonine-protein kinase